MWSWKHFHFLTLSASISCETQIIPWLSHSSGEKKGASRRFSSNKILSRHGSFSVSRAETSNVDDDTFEHILQVTAQHEAVMAYYYMDENNKVMSFLVGSIQIWFSDNNTTHFLKKLQVKVTEIFDVTDADSSVLLNPEEKMLNTQLQYDDDWDEAITGSWMSTQPSMAEEGMCCLFSYTIWSR